MCLLGVLSIKNNLPYESYWSMIFQNVIIAGAKGKSAHRQVKRVLRKHTPS